LSSACGSGCGFVGLGSTYSSTSPSGSVASNSRNLQHPVTVEPSFCQPQLAESALVLALLASASALATGAVVANVLAGLAHPPSEDASEMRVCSARSSFRSPRASMTSIPRSRCKGGYTTCVAASPRHDGLSRSELLGPTAHTAHGVLRIHVPHRSCAHSQIR
jgi:hypothetical protein